MRIASVGRALPPHVYDQERVTEALLAMWGDRPSVAKRLPKLLENTRVRQRHLALPIERYFELASFGESNDVWIECAQELGEQAVSEALARAGLGVEDVDAIFSVSVTGICSPSLDARLVNRMGLRTDIKRTPIFGLGCVAGVAGIARAVDYVKAYPDQVAVLLSVELCSLTFQRRDVSVANLIAAGLFGDGAAAVVVVGEERAARMGLEGLRVLDTRSVFYPDTEDIMGWRVSEAGFELVLSPAVPTVAEEGLAPGVDALLADHGLARADVATWVCHPGGPKVLSAMQRGLGLPDDAVRHAWDTLGEQGNLSSTSVLMVLRAQLDEGAPPPGARGLARALGPAFCSELVLFEWA